MRTPPEQLPLPGLAPPLTDRLFFALFLEDPAARQAVELAEALVKERELKGKPAARRRLHVSLHGLGDHAGLPADLVGKARAAGALVRAAPFRVRFDSVGSFIAKRRDPPLVLRSRDADGDLLGFHRKLGEAMIACGLGRRVAADFVPHVTLLYDRQQVAIRTIPPIAWTVHEFVLVHSLLGRTKHIPLARWSLSDYSQ